MRPCRVRLDRDADRPGGGHHCVESGGSRAADDWTTPGLGRLPMPTGGDSPYWPTDWVGRLCVTLRRSSHYRHGPAIPVVGGIDDELVVRGHLP